MGPGPINYDRGKTNLNCISAINVKAVEKSVAVFTAVGTPTLNLSFDDDVAQSYSLFKRPSEFGGGRLT